MKLVILKLGGSILTLKHRSTPVFRTRVTDRIVKEIKKALREQNFKLILVHGTGSFGHPVAHQYHLEQGIKADPSLMGFSKSKRLGHLLNGLLWEVLDKNSVPAVTIPPFPITFSDNKKILSMNLHPIKDTLNINRTPVLFGDEVLDKSIGYSICSSDQIATYLASKLKADLLLFATDVDGIYTQNPKTHPLAKKISKINLKQLPNIKKRIIIHNNQDVSGEMAGKLESIFQFDLSQKITIRIFNGLKPGQVYNALTNKPVGTQIHF